MVIRDRDRVRRLPRDRGANDAEEFVGRKHQQASQARDIAPQVCQYCEREVVRRHEARLEEARQVMPKVGKKTFPYTAKGKMQAKAAAKKSGKKMTKAKGY